LGARDTLRQEAGMPLYGHELSDQIDPFQAGLGFAVNLSPAQFGKLIENDSKHWEGLVKQVGAKLE